MRLGLLGWVDAVGPGVGKVAPSAGVDRHNVTGLQRRPIGTIAEHRNRVLIIVIVGAVWREMSIAAAALLERAIRILAAELLPEELGISVLALVDEAEDRFELVAMVVDGLGLAAHRVVVVEDERPVKDGQVGWITIAVGDVTRGGTGHVGLNGDDARSMVAPEPDFLGVLVGNQGANTEPIEDLEVIGKEVSAARGTARGHDFVSRDDAHNAVAERGPRQRVAIAAKTAALFQHKFNALVELCELALEGRDG